MGPCGRDVWEKKLTRGCLERVCARAEGDKGPCLEKVGGRTLRGEGNFFQHIVCTVGNRREWDLG